MKQKLRVFCTLLLCAVASVGWAEEVIFDYPEIYKGTDVLVDVTTDTQNNVTLTYSKGSSSSNPRYYVNGNALRLYKGNTFTVSSDKVITQIVMTSSNSTLGNFSTSTGTYNKGTWTGRANIIVFDISAAARLTKVVVTLEGSTTETVATPTFSPAAGIYTSAQNVTISCTTADATIHYTLDGSTPTAESDTYTSAIPVNSTTTIKAIAYVGEDASSIAEATYTILTLTTIDVARSAENDATVCTGGTVTSISGSTAYIQDATAAIVLYGGNTNTLNVGDEVTVYGTRTEYSGLVEITNAQSTVVSQNNEVSPVVKTISEINTDYSGSNGLQAMLVKIEDATVTAINGDNTTIAQGENTINIYKLSAEVSVNDKITSFVANIGCYNGVQLVNAKDVVVEQATEPAIVVETTAVELGQGEAEGTIEVTYQNVNNENAGIVFYAADGETIATYDWIEAGLDENHNVHYTVSANSGDARTAYLKVYALDDADNEVYSELITVAQAAYAVDYATLPFEWEGGASSDFTALVGVTANGLGSDYAAGNAPYLMKLDNTGDYIMVKTDSRPGKVTINVKMLGGANTSSITIQGSSDGSEFSDVEELEIAGAQNTVLTLETSNDFAENDRYVKLIFTKGSNVGVGAITIAKYTTSASITVAETEVSLTAAESEGTIGVTYKNLADVPVVVFFAADGTTAVEYDWIVAEIDGNNISYMVEANEGEARSAYMKVHGLDAEENDVYSDLITITQAAAVTPGTGDSYKLFSGDLVEGDYIIYFDGNAMNTTVDNDRLQYAEVTPENNVITTDNAAIVWHIAPNGEYWTIYNADADAYAASTGAKNKAQMLTDGTDDKALWTVSGTETYDFVNKANAAANVNAYLRKNGTYGFACYAEGTGGALSLYKKVEAITLSDVNSEDLPTAANPANVTLTRKFVNKWNPICLPFDVTDLSVFGEGYEVVKYTGDADNNGNVSLKFETVDKMVANVPYMVWVNEDADVSEPWELTFNGVKYNPSNNPVSAGTNYNYVGVYKNYAKGTSPIVTGDVILSGGAYKTVTGNGGNAIKGFRGYWKKSATACEAKSITAIINGQETDDIKYIELVETLTDGIFNLQGQKVNHAQKGVFIVNGKKVVIK